MEPGVRYCTTADGVHIAYASAGEGPAVIRVLGWLSNLEYSPDHHPIWRPWHDALVPRHRVVTYDGRGCGLSDRDVADRTLAAKVRDVEAVVEALGLSEVALLGTSEGGMTAIAYAARHPEKVTHLVLYDAFPFYLTSESDIESHKATVTLLRRFWGTDAPAFRQFFAALIYPDGDSQFYEWFDGAQRASATAEQASAFFDAMGPYDVRGKLGQLAMPTLVIHRRGDMTVPFEVGRAMAAAVPGARFLALEGRNHFVLPGEPAADVLFPALVDFLDAGAADAQLNERVPREPWASVPVPAPPHNVFISYAAEDKSIADRLCTTLERAGLACWIAPRDIAPGDDYAGAIVAALAQSQALVLVFSEHANRSPHVRRELDRAVSRDLPVLPVRIENAALSPSLEYLLSTCQWLDAFDETLEPALTQLTARLLQLAGIIR